MGVANEHGFDPTNAQTRLSRDVERSELLLDLDGNWPIGNKPDIFQIEEQIGGTVPDGHDYQPRRFARLINLDVCQKPTALDLIEVVNSVAQFLYRLIEPLLQFVGV